MKLLLFVFVTSIVSTIAVRKGEDLRAEPGHLKEIHQHLNQTAAVSRPTPYNPYITVSSDVPAQEVCCCCKLVGECRLHNSYVRDKSASCSEKLAGPSYVCWKPRGFEVVTLLNRYIKAGKWNQFDCA